MLQFSGPLTTTVADIRLTVTKRSTVIFTGVNNSVSATQSADMLFRIPTALPQTSGDRLRLLGDLVGVSMDDVKSWTLYDFYHLHNDL